MYQIYINSWDLISSLVTFFRFGVSKLDDIKISNLKTAIFGNENFTEEKKRKRKFKGGPNPLSCKKKKKNLSPQENVQKTEDKKRKKRKRIKIPQHVKESLINNSS